MGVQDKSTTTTVETESNVMKKKKRKRSHGNNNNNDNKKEDRGECNKDNNDTKVKDNVCEDNNNAVAIEIKTKATIDNDEANTSNDPTINCPENDPMDSVAGKSKRKRKRKRKTKSLDEDDSALASSDTNKQTHLELASGIESHDSKVASLDRTIYVEGLPFDATQADIQEWFESRNCGDITEMRLATWHDTGRLRGYGHVVFASLQSRDCALETCHGQTMGTRYLTLCPAKAPKSLMSSMVTTATATTAATTSAIAPLPSNQNCRTVFVKNLPYHATEDDIRECFQGCGKIVDGGIRIARHSNNMTQSKGFAYVEYKNPEGAQSAVEKASSKPLGLSVLGRPVFVDYDDKGGRMKGSYKLPDGRLWTKQYGARK